MDRRPGVAERVELGSTSIPKPRPYSPQRCPQYLLSGALKALATNLTSVAARRIE
jgi:hypothetical protein